MTDIDLRPVGETDEEFLRHVYGTTRADELATTGWPDDVQAAFVAMQFAAQSAHYAQAYEEPDHSVIVVDGQDAGRFYVARLTDEIRVVDISLLPHFRGRGVGTRLLSEIVAEAGKSGRRVTIHVEHQNRARQLYERLGFAVVEDLGIYFRMEWPAPATS